MFAQSVNDHHLGQPQDSIVYYQNLTIAFTTNRPNPIYTVEFVSAEVNKVGGITLTYKHNVPSEDTTYVSFHQYVFNTKDELIKDIMIFPASHEYREVERLKKELGYYKINDKLLYHKTANLKVSVETTTINGKDWALLTYMRKENSY